MKLGMIGAGFVARFQAVAMMQVRGLELGALLNRGGTQELARFSQENNLGPAKIYDSITEMAKQVDILAIYAPNYARIAIMEEIVDAVKSGAELKGVICEKPLGRSVAEARRLVQLAAEANLRTAYFENQIYMKPIRKQLDQLALVQKVMGPLSLARASEEHAGPHEPWFWDPARQGGGVLSDMGCHSIAVGWYVLTPLGREITFLKPQTVSAEVALLKWGLPEWRKKLLEGKGIDYDKTPAEDFATGVVTYLNPDTGQRVKAQFTNSWMFDKQGLRLFMDGLGPGYAFEVNTLVSPLTVFVGDVAAASILDQEATLEKSTASRGLLAVHHNEADLYGYTDENQDALEAFSANKDAFLPWSYGLEITRLVMAAYMAAERQKTIDLTDPAVQQELESYIPAIQQGHGKDVL
ncbi:Gfo/Idh/MocA family oxidoreductase [Acidobacteria bacterium AH-259-O06]|nr:Gfo/Idh/MocA family oxidoreductase [Acidobacteria bacterium AH-259-O06]